LKHGLTIDSQGQRLRFEGWRSNFEVDDVVQETFVRAFAEPARQGYDGIRPFVAYLTVIARNLLIDAHRRSQRAARLFVPVSGDELQAEDVQPNSSPEQQAQAAELAEAWGDFVDGLETKERTLLELRLGQRAPRREVCKRTGWSAMQVRTRESKLVQRLLDFLAERGLARAQGGKHDRL
jgi:RNA polymerase sigma factor (sigma-70 family)